MKSPSTGLVKMKSPVAGLGADYELFVRELIAGVILLCPHNIDSAMACCIHILSMGIFVFTRMHALQDAVLGLVIGMVVG